MRVGLTGGIASGKTACCEFWMQTLGIPVVDADHIARALVVPGSPALMEIFARFGAAVAHKDGSLNRRALRQIIAHSASKRAQLEAILHPQIHRQLFAQAAALESEAPYVVLAVPLLIENRWQQELDIVVVVDTPEPVQMARLMARDHHHAEEARRMIALQTRRFERLKRAHFVIDNRGEKAALAPQIRDLHEQLLRLVS